VTDVKRARSKPYVYQTLRAQGYTEEQIPGWFTREAKPHKAKEGDVPPGQATQLDLPTLKGAPLGQETPGEIPEEGEINVPIGQEDSDTPPGSPGYRLAPGGLDLAPSGLSPGGRCYSAGSWPGGEGNAGWEHRARKRTMKPSQKKQAYPLGKSWVWYVERFHIQPPTGF